MEKYNIGEQIEKEVRKQGISIVDFAKMIHCNRNNVYNIFKRQTIDVLLLKSICEVLNRNFFSELAKEINYPYENIKIEELKDWIVDEITKTIHGFESDDENAKEFLSWAKLFEREEAEFVVGIEFVNDWGYDDRKEIPVEEAADYAHDLMQRIVNCWYL